MIRLFGHSMISIDDKIVIDPHDGGSIGLPRPSLGKADLVLITHDHFDHNAFQILESKDVRVSLTNSLTYLDYRIESLQANHDRNGGKSRGKTSIYIIRKGSLSFTHMGDIGEFPKESLLKSLTADFLALPVGGIITIDHKEAHEIVKELKPSVIIPLHYWVKGHLMPIDPPDPFLDLEKAQIHHEKQIDENNFKKGIYLA
ncbi:MBL fold metallo-hydrolase [Metallosphaera hakonensis]|uniref:Hydrolase n=1 Tax=Metallosphaera hakonensis JCM 8857 = DSM 7519 TaxID=1293036 RepID=A0A2U9IRY5_9CREN|nr:MBL fold metallo-hydrolase [Metallosphaera hakonensis]AWR98800.1 hydrolase [Metallosphaera hakonensis JCM 8857 = DSM 7519]